MQHDHPSLLLVDDDPEVLAVLQLVFADQGYHVTQTRSGAAALAVLRTTATRYVVLLDALMPGLDGAQCLATIAQHPVLCQQHRYLVLTGWYTTQEMVSADLLARVGALLLHKPFDLAFLSATVARLAQQVAPGPPPLPARVRAPSGFRA